MRILFIVYIFVLHTEKQVAIIKFSCSLRDYPYPYCLTGIGTFDVFVTVSITMVESNYEKIKQKAAVSGIVPLINDIFGSNIVCDDAVMFGGQPIDDDLLKQIGDVVHEAMIRDDISLKEAREFMGVAYEYHTEIEPNRMESMITKGRKIAHDLLDEKESRNKVVDFCEKWGTKTVYIDSKEANKLFEERNPLFSYLGENIFPDFCRICGVRSKFSLCYDDTISQFAVTNRSFKTGDMELEVVLYPRLMTLRKRAVDALTTIAHEMHHCNQSQEFYRMKLQSKDDSYASVVDGKVSEVVVYSRLYSSENYFTLVNNPLEQEAHAVETAFEVSMEDFMKSPYGDRSDFIDSLVEPCDKGRKQEIVYRLDQKLHKR